MPDGNTILSVAKAMELLQLLSGCGRPMTLKEITEQSGFPKSTVFGLRSISAPVHAIDGHVKYTVGVIGMFRSAHSEEFASAIEQVKATAGMISAALGYRE